ncbi:hypothetical protein FOY51_21765 [Antrihabitans cavernicola]|uniref:Mce-associated membrane protein n=1 Tax=Antrihabitans cavernicola TaxID=2495913 RepID=A0A5A7S8Y2_9NOCA|nr:hypothetical protein FOY51_21765 [Spelaeibacter cavernicola]
MADKSVVEKAVPEKVAETQPVEAAEDKADPVVEKETATPEPTVAESPDEVTAVDTGAVVEDATTDEASAASSKPRRRILPARKPSLKPRVADGESVADDDTASDATPKRSRIGWKLVAALAALAVLLGAFAVVAVFKPGGNVSNAAWVNTAETQEVSSAARSAIETLYTYKYETVDQDFDKARAVLNPSMKDEFNRTADTTKSAVVQTKTATQAEVTDVGIKVLSDDRAELVASMNVSASNDGVVQGSAQGPLSVSMEKVDGKWLLSKIADQ